MYDFWFAMGVAVIKPALLDEINKAGPVFDFLDRFIIEVNDGQPVLRPKAPRAGVLENAPTTSVRLAIAKFVRNYSAAAPPIGIYCAGRFCQMLKIPFFSSAKPANSSFRDIMALANQAYLKAIGVGPESTLGTFPAFLGLCLLDGNLVFDFKQPTPELQQVASEFGITINNANLEWKIATTFVQTPEFLNATQLLMASDSGSWVVDTLEQAFFWKGFTEHAIP